METTDFEDVLREACGEAGTDADNIAQPELAAWRRFANRRLDAAWRYHYWPDLGRCEQRFYRLPYNAATTYNGAVIGKDNSANEVWWALTGRYYVALRTTQAYLAVTNLNNPDEPNVAGTYIWSASQNAYVQSNSPDGITRTITAMADSAWGLNTPNGVPAYQNDTSLTGVYYQTYDGTNLQAIQVTQVTTTPTDDAGNINLNFWGVTQQFAIEPDRAGTYHNPPYPDPVLNYQGYDPTALYVQGQRLQYGGNVYQLFASTAQGILPTNTGSWGLIPPFDAYVPYEQAGQSAFSIVEECFSANPRTTTRGNTLNYFLSERGVQVLTPIAYAWIQFRLRCPKLNGDMFRADICYPVGQGMYFSSATTPGNFYTAMATTSAGDTPETAAGKWCLVKIPRIFHRYLVMGMAADWEKDLTGENIAARSAAITAQEIAQAELDDVKSLFVGQMGQRVKTQIRTR